MVQKDEKQEKIAKAKADAEASKDAEKLRLDEEKAAIDKEVANIKQAKQSVPVEEKPEQ